MKDFEKKWEQYFDAKARNFGNRAKALGYKSDRVYFCRRDAVLETLQKLFHPLRDRKILDCGCGNGLFTRPLVSENRVTGIDVSEEMLKIAKENGLDVVRGSVLELPFDKDSFDIVISAGVLQHLENAEQVSYECARVVRPGGAVLIETINNGLPRRIYRAVSRKSAVGIKPYRIQDVILPMEKAGLHISGLVFLYYPLSYRRKNSSANAGILNSIFSSAFVAIGRK